MKKSIIPFFAVLSLFIISTLCSQEPGFEFVGSVLDGNINDMVVKDEYLIYSAGSKLKIYDKSDLSNLEKISECLSCAIIWNIEVFEDFAIVSHDEYGISIVDISDIHAPIVVSHYDEECKNIIVHNNYLFTDDGDIFDLTSIPDLTHTTRYNSSAYFDIEGDFLYSSRDDYLLIQDISDISDIVIVDSCDVDGVLGILAHDGHVYIKSDSLHIIHVVNANLDEIDSCFIEYTFENTHLNKICENNDLIYLLNSFEGLFIKDFTYPRYPVEVGRFSGFMYALNICFEDSIAFIYGENSNGSSSIAVVNISEPSFPIYLSSIELIWRVSNIVPNEDFVYLDYEGGVQILDVSDPIDFEEVYTFRNASNYCLQDTIFYCTRVGLEIYNVSDPYHPELISHISEIASVNHMIADGDYLYILGLDNIKILDVSNPSSPAVISVIDSTGYCNTGVIYDNKLFYYSPLTGSHYLDISDPYSPEYIGRFDVSLRNFDIADGYLACASLAGLTLYDISDLTDPTLVGTLENSLSDLVIDGDRIIAFGEYGRDNGIMEINIETPSSMTIEKFTPFESWYHNYSIEYNAPYIYCTSFFDCLFILREFEEQIFETNEKPDEFDFSVYPNPFNSSVNISINNGFKIYDTSGKLIETIAPQNNSYNWQPKNIESGIYLIKIDNSYETKKVIYLK